MPDLTSIPFLFWFACALSCGITTTWLFHIMREEINAKLPERERVSALFGYPGLLSKVRRIHRRFYPRSPLRLVLNLFMLLGALCLIGLARALKMI
jgi:hypothetical protein